MRITSDALLTAPVTPAAPPAAQRPVFSLRPGGDRIDGSVPVWGAPATAQEEVASTLTQAQAAQDPTHALSLSEEKKTGGQDQSFGFLDLVDMLNPLQQLPVVGTIYRALTGDQIKPVSQIVGGAIFGGPLGAAGGIVNAIAQETTGQDVGGNILGLITGRKTAPPVKEAPDTTLAVADLSYRAPHYNE